MADIKHFVLIGKHVNPVSIVDFRGLEDRINADDVLGENYLIYAARDHSLLLLTRGEVVPAELKPGEEIPSYDGDLPLLVDGEEIAQVRLF